MTANTRFYRLIILLILIISVTVTGVQANKGDGTVSLQIITVNDFHGALMESGKNPGAAKLATFLASARQQNPEGTLLLAAGDMMQGSIDSNLLYGKPVIDIMNVIGVDAMTLGNHEFDWNVNLLEERINHSRFPYVCANLIDQRTGKSPGFVKPYIVVEREGIKIGIIGIATPETAIKTNPKMIVNYIFADPVSTVSALIPEIKEHGADLIIVLTHLDSFINKSGQVSGDAAKLAQHFPNIQAVISGHSHQVVAGMVNEVPVVQAGQYGRFIGKLEITVNAANRNVETTVASVVAVDGSILQADSTVMSNLEQSLKETEPIKQKVAGQTTYALEHDRNDSNETILGQWLTDTMRNNAGAEVAFYNTGGIRKGIAPGVITMGNLYEVIPFDNTICTVELTGKQIMKVLEYGLMNHKIGMVQYSGLKVTYNSQSSPDRQIVAVMAGTGKPLELDQVYTVAINDFLAAGGDGFTMLQEGKKLRDTGILVRDSLADALGKKTTIDFRGDDRWKNLSSLSYQDKKAA